MSCVLMVEGMSFVVNGMSSLMSLMGPPPALCNLTVRMVLKLCTLGVFCFRCELGFINCDDIRMCVLNKHFELLELIFIPFMLTRSIMRCHLYCWELRSKASHPACLHGWLAKKVNQEVSTQFAKTAVTALTLVG